MAFRTQKISQMTPKGSNLEGSDLLEVSTLEGGSYVTRSITGQEIIDAASGSGVTSVTGTAPIASTGGSTPDISISQAGAAEDGYLTQGDWNAFNNKQDALSSGVNIKTINSTSVLGSGNIAVQNPITLTTTGTSGAATLVGATLNIPQYSGGGASGVHALLVGSGLAIYAGITTAGLSSTAQVTNRMFLYPFIPANTFTCSNLFLAVVTPVASSLGKILIYSNTNGSPNSLLYESASLDLSTSGKKTATTTLTFTAGVVYWLAFWGNSTPTLYTIPTGNVLPIRDIGSAVPAPGTGLTATYTYGSAPTSVSGTSGANSAVPFIGITIA